MIRLALYSALSDRAGEGRVALIDEWSFDAPRTKDAVAALSALDLQGRVLVVLGPEDGIADRSLANLQRVQTVQVAELNAYDILRSDWVLFTDATVPGETEPASASPGTARPSRRAAATKAPPAEAPAAEASDGESPSSSTGDADPTGDTGAGDADAPSEDAEGSDQ